MKPPGRWGNGTPRTAGSGHLDVAIRCAGPSRAKKNDRRNSRDQNDGTLNPRDGRCQDLKRCISHTKKVFILKRYGLLACSRYTAQPYGTSSSSLFRCGGRGSQFHESRKATEDGAAALEPPDSLLGERNWRTAIRATVGKSLSNRRGLSFLERRPTGAGTSRSRGGRCSSNQERGTGHRACRIRKRLGRCRQSRNQSAHALVPEDRGRCSRHPFRPSESGTADSQH